MQLPDVHEVSVLSRFVFGHTATLDAYLWALGRKYGEEVAPEAAPVPEGST